MMSVFKTDKRLFRLEADGGGVKLQHIVSLSRPQV